MKTIFVTSMKIPITNFIAFLLLLMVFSGCKQTPEHTIALSGKWHVRLDSTGVGVEKDWASEKFDETQIQLPGTLDDAGLGTENELEPGMNNYVLSHQYIGKAWYQREVNIPADWKDKHIALKLERVIWESQVYVDGKKAGIRESLVAPHHYNLTEALTPGKHLLTVVIDNSNKYPLINVEGGKYPDPTRKRRLG